MNSDLISRKEEIDNFIAFCKSRNISLSLDDFEFSFKVGLVAKSKNITKRLLPELNIDKENLVDFDELRKNEEYKSTSIGYAFGKNATLLASPFFRRGFSSKNNWSPGFLSKFWRFKSEKSKCYIALDLDRIRLPKDESIYFEKDRWYGPKFTGEIKEIQDGITRHVFSETGNNSKTPNHNNIYAIEVKWVTENNKKSFQLIELRDRTINTEDGTFYPAKYMHAEFDLQKNEFTHFDGAIQLLKEDEYFQVKDCFFSNSRKSTNQVKAQYHKLFKINYSVTTEEWVEFVGDFCSHNPLIEEYFSTSS